MLLRALRSYTPRAARRPATVMAQPRSFYTLKDETTDGEEFDFSQLKGQVIYGVNVSQADLEHVGPTSNSSARMISPASLYIPINFSTSRSPS